MECASNERTRRYMFLFVFVSLLFLYCSIVGINKSSMNESGIHDTVSRVSVLFHFISFHFISFHSSFPKPLIEFFLAASRNIQEELFSGEIGPSLAGCCFEWCQGPGFFLFVVVWLLLLFFHLVVVPSQFDRETVVAHGMIPEDKRVGTNHWNRSESNVSGR